MRQVLLTKAHNLGISDADSLTDEQLKREVEYASLNSEGRRDLARGQGFGDSRNRTVLPLHMVVRRVA